MDLLASGRGVWYRVRHNSYYRPHRGLSWDWAHSWTRILVWLFGLLSSASHISSCNLLQAMPLYITCTQILAQGLHPANERPTLLLQALSFDDSNYLHIPLNCLSAFDLPFLHFFQEKPLTQAPGHPPSDTDHILQLQLLLPFQVSLASGCTKQPLFSKYTSVCQGVSIFHKLCLSSEVSFLTFSSQQIHTLPSKVFPASQWQFP